MSLALDHVLVCAPVGAPHSDKLLEAGFLEGSPNRHLGQGTANRRFFFDNAFLEFIWVENEQEAHSALVQPTRLWERWRWRETGASPFGICLRVTDGNTPPFETFDYRPPYIPEGASIQVASDTLPGEPMLFINTLSVPPTELSGDARQPLEHSNGARELSHLHLGAPDAAGISAALLRVSRCGFVTAGHSREHILEISFDARRQGQRLDLQPHLPLILHW
jgi:hypothetical protein